MTTKHPLHTLLENAGYRPFPHRDAPTQLDPYLAVGLEKRPNEFLGEVVGLLVKNLRGNPDYPAEAVADALRGWTVSYPASGPGGSIFFRGTPFTAEGKDAAIDRLVEIAKMTYADAPAGEGYTAAEEAVAKASGRVTVAQARERHHRAMVALFRVKDRGEGWRGFVLAVLDEEPLRFL